MTTPSPQKYFPVSWEELHRNAKALAWKLHDMGPWKGLIAVTRGGLVPSAIVARELDIRVIDTVGIVGYRSDDRNPGRQAEAKIIKAAANVGEGEGWFPTLTLHFLKTRICESFQGARVEFYKNVVKQYLVDVLIFIDW